MSQPYAPPRDPTAVLVRRFAAFAIDLLFLAVIGVIVLASANHHNLYGAPPGACSSTAVSDSSLCFQIGDHLWAWGRAAVVRTVLLGGLAAFLDLVVLQTLTGASVGKLCVGLRVIEVHGNEARFLRMLGRGFFLAVDLGCFLVGLITTLATRPHRRVGDLVCGTYVVGVTSVGQPVVFVPFTPPAYATTPPAYAPRPGAHAPPGWGSPTGWAAVPPPAPVATPPGTAPTTPGEWGAVARPGPALVRSPAWEAPPPPETGAPAPRGTTAPQWATPPGPQAPEPEPPADASPPADQPAPPSIEPQWSPVVPLTNDGSPPAATPPPVEPPPSPWRPVVPASPDEPGPTPPPAPGPTPPAPAPPVEPVPPPPTEPEPPPPAAAAEPAVEPEPEDDEPWWDATPSRHQADG
jgi:uncharacterized RDD family membrane protein YckC